MRNYPKFLNEEAPTGVEIESHLNQIMGQKVSKDTHRNDYNVKIFETALKEKSLDVYFVMSICVQCSRQAYMSEFRKIIQKFNEILSDGSPQKVVKGYKTSLIIDKSSKQSSISFTEKRQKMFIMLHERNQEVEKSIKKYFEVSLYLL